ncbi:MAG: alcohol dehydrogenase catalytic domain-containing protein [Coriobacteriales bacterium]|jgi:(R,R)-butanediol dehydrogenase/meso-butanediol dehydrogenase/diacetyl reductase/L-iditol 2-dehydrogenase|nr:alcohol dehydrogenase catalytic domain-containing protein [Coriobacteriales bacterium]
MKAVYVTRTFDGASGTPGKVEVLEVAKPAVRDDDDVLVHIAYSALCGSDAHYIKDNLFPFEPPFAVGHEFSGVIEEAGAHAVARGFAPGDEVTGNFVLECGFCDMCRTEKRQFCEHATANGSAQAEYIVLKAAQLYHLPPGTSLLEGALIEPFTIACGVIDKARLRLGHSVLILGAGSIGQMLVQLARLNGASLVAASARTPSKRELALNLGANAVIDPLNEDIFARSHELAGPGFDVVLEASGSLECAQQALDLVAPGGTVILMSYYPPDQPIAIDLFKQVVVREITLSGLQLSQNNWPRALRMFSRVDVRPLISKVYPLQEAPQAYADLIAGRSLKLVLDCRDVS